MSPTRNRMFLVLAMSCFVLLVAACSGGTPPPPASEDAEQAPAAQDDSTAAEQGTAPVAQHIPAHTAETQPAPAPSRPQQNPAPSRPAAPAAPPAPVMVTVNVPSGTEVEVEILDALSSGTSAVGDAFRARLTRDLVAEGWVIAPAGAEVLGRVTEVVPLKKFGGQPQLTVTFDSLELDGGGTIPVMATLVQVGKKQAGRDAAKIGGGAAAGAVVGHQIDGDKGKAIGAIVGGAIGTAVAAKTGKEVEIPAGTVAVVTLEDGFSVQVES